MTAIGFVLSLIGLAVAWYDELDTVPSVMLFAAGACLWVGCLLMLAGFTTWLWRVMP